MLQKTLSMFTRFKRGLLFKKNYKLLLRKPSKHRFFFCPSNIYSVYYSKNLIPLSFIQNQNSIKNFNFKFNGWTISPLLCLSKRYTILLSPYISCNNTIFLYKMFNHVLLRQGQLLNHQCKLSSINLIFMNFTYLEVVRDLVFSDDNLSSVTNADVAYSKFYAIELIFSINDVNHLFIPALICGEIVGGNTNRANSYLSQTHNRSRYFILFLYYFAVMVYPRFFLGLGLFKILTFLSCSALKTQTDYSTGLRVLRLLSYHYLRHSTLSYQTTTRPHSVEKNFTITNTLIHPEVSNKTAILDIYKNSSILSQKPSYNLFSIYVAGMPFIFILKQSSLGRKLRKILKGSRRFKKILFFIPKYKRVIVAAKQFRLYSQFLTKKSYITRVLEQLICVIFNKLKSPLYLSYLRQQVNILGQLLKSKKRN